MQGQGQILFENDGKKSRDNDSRTFMTNQYLLDLSGNQVTELNTTGGPMAWAHSNVWAGAHLNATYDTLGLHFHLSDPLGTRRVQTNYLGGVENTFQSLPFGDGFQSLPTALATADDATENHFTGKERDTESGNDYFGARYYGNSMGRFMSPDWTAEADPVPWAELDNPQSLNLYAYVQNNPLRRTDPNGHCGSDTYSTNANGDSVITAHPCPIEMTALFLGGWPRSHNQKLRVAPVPRFWGPGILHRRGKDGAPGFG